MSSPFSADNFILYNTSCWFLLISISVLTVADAEFHQQEGDVVDKEIAE